MGNRLPPRSVHRSIILNDRRNLSRLGRLGAQRKKELALVRAVKKERELALALISADEMALQAHEDICPLPD